MVVQVDKPPLGRIRGQFQNVHMNPKGRPLLQSRWIKSSANTLHDTPGSSIPASRIGLVPSILPTPEQAYFVPNQWVLDKVRQPAERIITAS
jgi:hypothetical protein